ncbi:MAG: hypothetical protein ACOCVL_04150 [Candidatus Sumerlaeota bacterium]
MPLNIETIHKTGKTVYAVLKRLSDEHLWNNSSGSWEDASESAAHRVALSEAASPDLRHYSGSNSGDLGNAGWARVYLREADDGVLINAEDVYIVNGAEARAAVSASMPGVAPITIQVDGVGLQGVACYVSLDASAEQIVLGPVTTDANGEATLMVTVGETYRLWAVAPSGYNNIAGAEFTASPTGHVFTTTEIDTSDLDGGSLYALSDEVLVEVGDVPENRIYQALRLGAHRFVMDTECWRETITVNVEEAGKTFALASSYAALVKRILKVEKTPSGGTSAGEIDYAQYQVTADGCVVFDQEQEAGASLDILVALMPKRSADNYPEWLLLRWGHAIVAAAASYLGSEKKEAEYRITVSNAKREEISGRHGSPYMGSPPKFI